MTPNKWRKWAALLWAACLFVTVIGPAIENRGAKIMAGLVVLVGCLAFLIGTWKYWRCPECGGLLRLDWLFAPPECPHCGYKVEK